MKKLMIVPIMALGMLFTTNINAQVDDSKKAVSEQTAQEEYTQIDKAKLPVAVTTAVQKDFKGSSVAEAYIGKDKTYKLILVSENGEKGMVFVNENGKWIKPSK